MKQLTFLLIDDDQDDHFIFSNALDLAFPDSLCSYTFNCPEAIELLNGHSMVIPDFIFMDWSMPYMNAIECIKSLKEIKDIAETPMYILSSSKPSFEIQHIVGLHIKKVLQKQDSIQQLANEIQQAVGGY
ncbi:response regulator [Dyadobacter sp. CY345]|uniref:response regulator n=1 Tax=Dyadobacter sp. CY345 TaxID=2909335 RepID=UPI001F46B188|nr:response regulator [Dyadobacter sp. CY345]MCF2447142.1 response regulator [Dyadobacter sp. CY345]